MQITHNIVAANGMRQLAIGENKAEKSSKKLATGYRINAASDDAAGLTISEKMRWQIRGLNKSVQNAQDGISYISTAEGALDEMHSMLSRCKELCVEAANDTNSNEDRAAIQEELNDLWMEVDRIASTTQYNSMNVFSDTGVSPAALSVSLEDMPEIDVTLSYIDASGTIQTVKDQTPGSATSYSGDKLIMANYIKNIVGKAAEQILSAYPALKGASSDGLKIGLNLKTMDGAGGTLASASLRLTTGSETLMTYTMNVDTADYNILNYDKGGLAATLAHEMTHLIMYDTLTGGMIGKNTDKLPLWFVEGMAQTASGDNGWMGSLSAGSSDSDIKSYLSKVSAMPYGAGYLATMYLGQMASGSAAVSTASLRGGINQVLEKLVSGKTLSQVINEVSGGRYRTYGEFQNKISSDPDALQFTKDFIAARGSGAGSVIAGGLTTAEKDILSAATYGASYIVDPTVSSYTNRFDVPFSTPGGGGGGGTAGGGAGINLQVGALSGQSIQLTTFDVSTVGLFDGSLFHVAGHMEASDSIDLVDEAINRVSKVRGYYGAMQNRLEHVIAGNGNTSENTSGAESLIRDTDMAEEMVAYSAQNIINQAAQAVLAQGMKISEGVLALLN